MTASEERRPGREGSIGGAAKGFRLCVLFVLAAAASGARCPTAPAEVLLHNEEARVLKEEGAHFTLRAVVRDRSGRPLPNATVRWRSSAPTVASVVDGVVTAHGTGRTTVTATAGGVTAKHSVRVAIPSSVQVAPKRVDALPTGSTAAFTATVRDERGRTLKDEPVRWTSTNESVVVVSSSGKASAKEAGVAQVVASVGDLSATAELEVVPGNFVRIGLEPMRLELTVGQRQRIAAYGLTSEGDQIKDLRVRWTSSNPQVATVDELGWVTAKKSGRALIAVMLGRRKSAADVFVEDAKEAR